MCCNGCHFRNLIFAVGLLALAFATSAAQGAKKYTLRSRLKTNDAQQVHAEFKVGGRLMLFDHPQVKSVPMEVKASFDYQERALEFQTGDQGESTSRAVRYYDQAQAELIIDKKTSSPKLPAARRLTAIVIEPNTGPLLYSPLGPLTQGQLDLINLPANSLLLDRMLPPGKVHQGDSWKHSSELISWLVGVDAVSQCEAVSTLVDVQEGVAKMVLSGAISGAIAGVSTDIELKGKYNFDLRRHRITWFALLIKEKRAVGHANPGLEVVAQLTMRLSDAKPGVQLTDAALKSVDLNPRPELTSLLQQSPSREYELLADRRWNVMDSEGDLTVMRFIDRGELVAQCNIAKLDKLPPNKVMTLSEFQDEVRKALGDRFGQFIQAGQSATPRRYQMLRVVVGGESDKLPVQCHYYQLTNPTGRRLAFVFTMEADLAESFVKQDQNLVLGTRFTEPKLTAART